MDNLVENWEFWGVVVAILIFLISAGWVLYERRKNRKVLSYLRTGSNRLVALPDKMLDSNRLQILFDKEVVRDPYLSIITIKNSGRIPIVPEDFREPLTFVFQNHIKIVTATKFDSKPDELNPTFSILESKVKVDPLLLNEGDIFKVSFITDGDPNIEVIGRIVGVNEISKISSTMSKLRAFILFVTGIILGSGFAFAVDNFEISLDQTELFTGMTLFILVGVAANYLYDHFFSKDNSDVY